MSRLPASFFKTHTHDRLGYASLPAAAVSRRAQLQQFHTLKNLIISLNLEAGELLELTQWKTDAELAALTSDESFRQALQEECADVLLYLLLIAENGGIDLLQAAQEKIKKNALRYPVDQAYGSAKKYTELKAAARQGNDLD